MGIYMLNEKIQTLRIKNALSQEILAEKLNVSRQSVSKWELGQAIPEVDKIIQISKLFSVSTDELLLDDLEKSEDQDRNSLHLGSVYLIVKDFQKSLNFYEQLLSMTVSTNSWNKFAEFFFDGKCLSLMNESNLEQHSCYMNNDKDYKFVLNFWVEDLIQEYKRIKSLNIGEVTQIKLAHPKYYYFHLKDPDNNIIEITGSYKEGGQ